MRDVLLPVAILVVVAAFIVALAVRHPLLARLALRNILRRKRHAALVTAGLLVGTAIISSSFVIGDTLDYIFIEDVYQRWDTIDEIVVIEANNVFYNYSYDRFETLRAELLDGTLPVDGVAPMLLKAIPIQNCQTDPACAATGGKGSQSITVIGLNASFEVGFGTFVTVGGAAVDADDLGPWKVFVNERAAKELNASAGDRLRLFYGVAPFYMTVQDVVLDESKANWNKESNVFMDLEQAQGNFSEQGRIEVVKISNEGDFAGGVDDSDTVAAAAQQVIEKNTWSTPLSKMEVRKIKADGLSAAQDFSAEITQIFFIMGSFSIIAGILLIVNLFVMLAEERKGEMGVARAVGMKRRHLLETFLFEGALYAGVSSVFGALLGVVIGYFIVYAFSVIFPGELALTFYFDSLSLALAFALGTLITVATVATASWKVSRLNIVRAIRDIPEPPRTRLSGGQAAVGVLLAGAGAVLTAYIPAALTSRNIPAVVLGPPLLMLGVATLISPRVGARLPFTAAGLGTLAWVLGPIFIERDDADVYLPFVVAGCLLVLGSVLAVMFNASSLLQGLLTAGGRRRGRPVMKIAVSYPLEKRFRTGMTLGMFSLILFTVTVISMIQGMQSTAVDTIVETQAGGYDIVAYPQNFAPIPDFRERLNASALRDRFSDVASATIAPVFVTEPGSNESVAYTIWGVDNFLIESNQFDFKAHASSYEAEDGQAYPLQKREDVWAALARNRSLAVADGSVASTGGQFDLPGTIHLDVGDDVVVGVGNATLQLRIIGILTQSLPFTRGLFVDQSVVQGGFPRTYTAYFLTVSPGVDPGVAAEELKELFFFDGLETLYIRGLVEEAFETSNRVLLLMQAFLGIGLLVGIAGLGVIAARIVVERRQQIGALRAMGFSRAKVRNAFLLEISFVAVLGIAIGVALGIVLAYRIWLVFFHDITIFVIPWTHLALVTAIAYGATLLCTSSPALRASRIPPAEALRYIE